MNIRVSVSDADLAQAQREVGWTELRERVAFALYADGKSDAQVACLIGGVTRNAVIGKRNRKGFLLGTDPSLNARAKLPNANMVIAGEPRSRGGPPRPATRTAAPRVVSPRVKRDDPPPPNIIDSAIPIEQRRSLSELTDNCCHWPVGDPALPDFFYCGAVAERKDNPLDPDARLFHPYCGSHMRRAHQPWQRRRGEEHPKSRLQIEEAAYARRG